MSGLLLFVLQIGLFACLQAKWSVEVASKNYLSSENNMVVKDDMKLVDNTNYLDQNQNTLDLYFNLVWFSSSEKTSASYPINSYLSLIRSSFATDEEKASKWWTTNSSTPILTIRNEKAALITTADHLLQVASNIELQSDLGQAARKRYLLQLFVATKIALTLVEQSASKHVTYMRMKHHLHVPVDTFMTFAGNLVKERTRSLLIEHAAHFPSPPALETDGLVVAQLVERYAREYLVPFLNRAHPAAGL